MEKKVFNYLYTKHAMQPEQKLLCDFKEMYAKSTETAEENKSNIFYLELVDENPDSSDTMKYVSELLLISCCSVHQNGYVVLTGDRKTYDHLMDIKRIYKSSLEKLLIFPGDWHTLKNYQPVLMNVYYHAGLRELAQVAGHKGETLTSLERCSNFDRTHNFLLQAWESIYRAMLNAFCSTMSHSQSVINVTEDTCPFNLLENSLITDVGLQKEFHIYVSKMADLDDTWKLWRNFVFKDVSWYLQLFLAIRCQNWDLRVSALKMMAPLFHAYDRSCYKKLIPNHLADLSKFPSYILESLKKAFTVSINGERGHSVAIDEAHEMCINKDLKMAIVHPTQSNLQKTSLFLRHRIISHKNLCQQLCPPPTNTSQPKITVFNDTPGMKKKEENITAMITEITNKCLLPASLETNRGILNVFSNIKAIPLNNVMTY